VIRKKSAQPQAAVLAGFSGVQSLTFMSFLDDWLKPLRHSIRTAGRVLLLLKLSWDEIHGILERAVKRGLERRKAELVSQMGVDEKAFRKGHSYC
jgi:transposase